ncbi:hypothetical protein [Neorhizobium galegae]|uniref:hypothetical protein n=1 Tax=Neorhizobium galegae TaxID=399 RepID=UPI0032AE87D1
MAKASDARVIATTTSREKAERLKDLGASEVIDVRAIPHWSQGTRSSRSKVGGTSLRPRMHDVASLPTLQLPTVEVQFEDRVGYSMAR